MDISPYHHKLQQRRQEQQTEVFKQEMKQCAAIEETISEAVRGHGLRRNRSRGLDKTQLQAFLTGTTINLKRLMAVFRILFSTFMNGHLIRFSTEPSMPSENDKNALS